MAQSTQQLLKSIRQFSEQVSHINDYQGLMSLSRETVRDVLGFQRICVHLYQDGPETNAYRLLAADGIAEEMLDVITELKIEGDLWLEEILSNDKASYCENAATDYRTNKEIVSQQNLCTIWVHPLKLYQQKLGYLAFSSSQEDGVIKPSLLEQDYAEAICAFIAVAIDRIRLQEYAIYDPLTQVLNRDGLIERGKILLDLASRHHRKLSVTYFDLNNLKPINDNLGHHVGDMILQQFSQHIQRALRKSDVFARLGGDEFVVVLPDINSIEEVDERFNQLLTSLPYITTEEQKIEISSSMGHALYPDDGYNLQQLLAAADQKMYDCKKAYHQTITQPSLTTTM